MTIQIDHVVIAGSDLAQLSARFEAVGLKPDPGGVHADGQTHNALLGFADSSYLELIAPAPGNTAPNHYWSSFMKNDAGVCAWAIRSNNIQADAELYRSRGITVSEPRTGGRTRPDGVRLEWITAKLGDEPLGSVLPFLIQDVTPHDWRVPFTKSTEGVITGVEKVLIDADGLLFDLIARAFDFLPSYTIHSSKLPLDVDTSFHGANQGVHGVLLNTTDLDVARQRYHAGENVFTWRDQLSVWPDLGSIILGFKGPMTRPTFDLQRFKRQLAETIAWCTAHASTADVEHSLRSSVPSMPDTLQFRDRGKSENEAARQLRRKRGYDSFFAARAERLKDEKIPVRSIQNSLDGGRLLVFDVNQCLYEGAMSVESEGFFDNFQDGPPWDTWTYWDTVEDLLICWIPQEFIPYAQAGLDVMSLSWNRWLTGDENDEFARLLKHEGFFEKT